MKIHQGQQWQGKHLICFGAGDQLSFFKADGFRWADVRALTAVFPDVGSLFSKIGFDNSRYHAIFILKDPGYSFNTSPAP